MPTPRLLHLALFLALAAPCAAEEEPVPPAPEALRLGSPAAQNVPTAEPMSPCRFLWERDLQTIRWLTPDARPGLDRDYPGALLNGQLSDDTFVVLDGVARGYYLNDQRIQWSGVEEVFGAEGILRPAIYYVKEGWTVSAEGEFFINQPFGRSILSDPFRDPFRANFDVDIFQVFQLYAQANYGDFYLRVGKSRTPFGAYSSPMFTNRLIDAPFIRTEVIAFTETGIFAHYEPGLFSLDLAFTNGEPDLDTNSSKAVIGRVGLQDDCWGVGMSVKWHDGISSENQKRYNSHVGFDAHMVLFERWVVYGEAIYDEYGFHRNFFKDPNKSIDALGPRSIYLRESFKADKSPIIGRGYYVAGGYRGDKVMVDASFGSYFPQQIGVLGHDDPIHRGVAKLAYNITTHLQVYAVGIFENKRDTIYPLSQMKPYAALGGMQFVF
jgi:hypothetical protein